MAATQEKSLSQFPTAAQILLTTLLFGSVVDATSSSGYDSVKILVSDLAEAILGDFAYTQDLATDAKTIFGAINSIRVLSGTATPNDADGANGQIYVKYASADYSVVALYVKLNNAWREISTGGGGGGASVQMGTTAPSDASGSDGDLYVQYDATTYAFVELFVKINGSWRKSPYSRVVSLTQAQYDLITPDPTTLYIITDAQSSYQTKSDNSLATTNKTIVGAINEVNEKIGTNTAITPSSVHSSISNDQSVFSIKGNILFYSLTFKVSSLAAWSDMFTFNNLTIDATDSPFVPIISTDSSSRFRFFNDNGVLKLQNGTALSSSDFYVASGMIFVNRTN